MSIEEDDFEAEEQAELEACQDEDGVYNLEVSPDHFLLKLCKCGHYYGRHRGCLSEPDKTGGCFDCGCKKYEPKEGKQKQ